METIIVEAVELKKLMMQRSELDTNLDVNGLQAVIKVQASKNEDSLLCIDVQVNDKNEQCIFTLVAVYYYLTNQSTVSQEVIDAVVNKIRPRVEELLSLLTLETGCIPVS